MQGKALDFFLGSLCPTGYYSYFKKAYPQLEHGTVLLLKSGPGCGKSKLLSRISQKLLADGETVERIHCSAHPDSLDGVICRRLQFAAFDATEPHCLEPDYPAAFEQIVPLYSYLDSTLLSTQRRQIAELAEQERRATDRAVRYLSAAACLLQDTERTALCCIDTAKIQRFAHTLSHRYFPMHGNGAREDIRLLSAVTPDGILPFKETISNLATNIVVLDDPFGAVGRILMRELRQIALASQHRVITCFCPLDTHGKIDHILLPEQNVAFILSNSFLPFSFETQRNVHATRFMNHDGFLKRKKRLRFNQKATRDLLMQARQLYSEAQQARVCLKNYYSEALCKEALSRELMRLEESILSSL